MNMNTQCLTFCIVEYETRFESIVFSLERIYPNCGSIKKFNKHKFVQKVAKNIILLISFKFNTSINFVQTGSKRSKRS